MHVILQTSLIPTAAMDTHGGSHRGPVPGAGTMLFCAYQAKPTQHLPDLVLSTGPVQSTTLSPCPDASGPTLSLSTIKIFTLILWNSGHSCSSQRVLWLSDVNVSRNHQCLVKKESLSPHRLPFSSSRRSPRKCTFKDAEAIGLTSVI